MSDKKPKTPYPDLHDIDQQRKREPDEEPLQHQPTDDPSTDDRPRKEPSPDRLVRK